MSMACFNICAGYGKCNHCPCVEHNETEIRINYGLCQCKVHDENSNDIDQQMAVHTPTFC